jgi:hypothetical protein
VLFDDWAHPSPSVLSQVDTLLSWTCPTTQTLRTRRPQPPLVTLDWGGAPPALAWLVADVTATFLLFDPQGEPIRATVDLILDETPTAVPSQSPATGARPATRERTVIGGDSLASVAAGSTATRGTGAPWPRPTASTTRCGCARGPCSWSPLRRRRTSWHDGPDVAAVAEQPCLSAHRSARRPSSC